MLRNILKISFRNLLKNKSHAFINVFGLSLGISAAIIIYKVIVFDLSFDNYHDDKESIYRVVMDEVNNGDIIKMSGTPYVMGENFKNDFNETEYLTIVDRNIYAPVISIGEGADKKKFSETERRVAFVQNDYFKIFKHTFIMGDEQNPFSDIKTVVLSKSYAEKYFGDYTIALGQTIRFDNQFDLVVSAIIEDVPQNTDFPFEVLINFELGEENKRGWPDWGSTSSSVQFFLKTKENVSIENFGANVLDYVQKNKNVNNPHDYKVFLQPLEELHFDQDRYVFTGRTTSWESIYTLIVIGVLLLLAACINFVNLNTALVTKRAKEIGIRKVLGSVRGMLIFQFVAETAIITLVALFSSLGLSELSVLYIDKLIGFQLPASEMNIELLAFLVSVTVVVTLLSSLYPAIILSNYNPAKALKSKMTSTGSGGFSLRKVLIVVQLFIAQALIVAVITVTSQINLFTNTPLGLDTEAIVEFSMPGNVEEFKLETLKNRMESSGNVLNVSFSNTGSISNNIWGADINYKSDSEEKLLNGQVKVVDKDYLATYGLQLVAGRGLNNDTTKVLINEKAAMEMGFSDPRDAVGFPVNYWGGYHAEVAGVVKNFNTNSLHTGIKPVLFTYQPNLFFYGGAKLSSVNAATIDKLKSDWEASFPELIFNHDFLDEKVSQFYANEKRVSTIFSTFGIIAMSIGTVGLIGLISFMANAKTKEIGIRKVLGARVDQIVYMLTKDFLVLIFIAFLLAVPVSYYFLDNWLSDFEYRISLSIGIFLTALLATAVVTLSAVGFKSLKAAMTNPADTLSDE